MINSEGIGGNKFSRNMAAKMAPYPNHWFASTACPISSGSWVISSDRPINNDDKVNPLFHTFRPSGFLESVVIHTAESALGKGEISLPSSQYGSTRDARILAASKAHEQINLHSQTTIFHFFLLIKSRPQNYFITILPIKEVWRLWFATKQSRSPWMSTSKIKKSSSKTISSQKNLAIGAEPQT